MASINIDDNAILAAARKLKHTYSPGPDGIPATLLKKCIAGLLTPLTHLFRLSLATGRFPTTWKQAFLFPVHKKGDRSKIDNYRGLSALCAISKLFELVVLQPIFSHFQSTISDDQHGFLPKRSCATNLLCLTNYAFDSFVHRHQTDVIYTDLSAAFDKVNHQITVAKLDRYGFSGNLLGWLESYLLGRTLRVKIGDEISEPFVATSGIAQGSHLGPLVFLLYFNDVHHLLKCPRLAFADDLKLFNEIKNVEDATYLQQQLNIFARWCKLNCMIYVSYAKQPNFYCNRLRIVEGTLELSQLGLADADLDYLRQNVNIVIHSAANVRFDVSLKTIIKTNVAGANELLQIALEMKNLVSFLYISTAYSNCYHEVVAEKFYDMDDDPVAMVRLVEMTDEHHLDVLSRKITQPWPNSYTYAKALAEKAIRGYCGRLPIAVIRPSIVISTAEDPIEGWTDNLYGLNGVVVGFGSGVLRILHCNKVKHVDIIPADLVVNSSLAVIWYMSTKQPNQIDDSTELVFNCTTRLDNPFVFTDVSKYSKGHIRRLMPLSALWYPTCTLTPSVYIYYVLQIFYHFIPAVLFDCLARLKGMEPKVLYIYRKVQQFSDVLTCFTMNEWIFLNDKMRKVYDSMTPEDHTYFPVDIRRINWGDFFLTYLLGLRKYILRESLENLKQSQRKGLMLLLAHYLILTLVYTTIAALLYKIITSSTLLGHGLEIIQKAIVF
ncbi:fatty acyl-CoA reductase wat-like [Wyeomyia smithii]|uniref:fatty acyl-CoA reductase wat-like n=1 Tax=Wyeomyia smithii TaxID=174621 RepID=UPI002467ED2B|nr:fatty acyl-CoA reductase wat-like [Wyeomyia smithii]